MPVSSYGGSTDSLASPSLSSWAASVSAALDGSDTTVNTRITQRVLPLTAKTGNYTLTASDEVVTCNGTLTITLPTAVGLTGKQFIIRNIATNTVTIARTSSQTIDGCSGTITLAGKGSMSVVSDGANWLVVSGQYTDESVGRRIFTWSSALANGATTGWQMTYGDTGWRDISASLSNSWAGGIYVRRQNATVFITGDADKTSATADPFWVIPSGFQPPLSNRVAITAWDWAAETWQLLHSSGVNQLSIRRSKLTSGAAFCRFSGSWMTSDSWPTSLPGTAAGSIPT